MNETLPKIYYFSLVKAMQIPVVVVKQALFGVSFHISLRPETKLNAVLDYKIELLGGE